MSQRRKPEVNSNSTVNGGTLRESDETINSPWNRLRTAAAPAATRKPPDGLAARTPGRSSDPRSTERGT